MIAAGVIKPEVVARVEGLGRYFYGSESMAIRRFGYRTVMFTSYVPPVAFGVWVFGASFGSSAVALAMDECHEKDGK